MIMIGESSWLTKIIFNFFVSIGAQAQAKNTQAECNNGASGLLFLQVGIENTDRIQPYVEALPEPMK